jgi:hypothetical protein
MSATEHLDAILAPIPHDFDDGQISERLQEHYFGASAELAKLRAELARLRAIEQAARAVVDDWKPGIEDMGRRIPFLFALAAALEKKP